MRGETGSSYRTGGWLEGSKRECMGETASTIGALAAACEVDRPIESDREKGEVVASIGAFVCTVFW